MIRRQENRSRTRMCPAERRRFSCYRHPEAPISGICASCLRERLNGLDISGRCKSVVSGSKYEGSSHEPRRKSCDVISSRSSLCELFGAEDLSLGSESEQIIDSINAAFQSKSKEQDPFVGPGGRLEQEWKSGHGGEDVEGKLKTMREFIDLETNKKTRASIDLKEMTGSLVGAASIISKKLLKWRKHDNSREGTEAPNEGRNLNLFHCRKNPEESHSTIVGARRSCEYTGSYFPLETGRMSLDQPRASWDGYMIARTIPRLTPMFSMVDDGLLDSVEKNGLPAEGTVHSIAEEKSSSRASRSSYSNSNSSSSNHRSSFDRSSSVRSCGKKMMGYEDCSASPANMKLVITQKELKDWNLSTKCTEKHVPWRQICKSLRFRFKNEQTFQGR